APFVVEAGSRIAEVQVEEHTVRAKRLESRVGEGPGIVSPFPGLQGAVGRLEVNHRVDHRAMRELDAQLAITGGSCLPSRRRGGRNLRGSLRRKLPALFKVTFVAQATAIVRGE